MKNIVTIKKIIDLLIKNNNYLLIQHDYPDADTIGSSIALCSALRHIGKKAYIYNNINVDNKYKKYLKKYILTKDNEINFVANFLITCDVSTISLISDFIKNKIYNKKNINLSIDHHKYSTDKLFAINNYINPLKSSCGEIIYQIIKKMKISINKDIVNGIYMAICGDTGIFKFENTTSSVHKIASWCLKNKADSCKIHSELFDSININAFRCLPWLNQNTHFYFNNKISVLILEEKILQQKFNICITELNDFIYLSQKIAKLKLNLIFKIYDDNIKLSIRSNSEISAFKISNFFGGGGHEKAAGVKFLKKSIDLNKLIRKIIKMIQSDIKGVFKSC